MGKFNLSEQISRSLELMGVSVLQEASKKDILVDKIGIEPGLAQNVVNICGKLSVWMVNKSLDFYLSGNNPNIKTKEDAVRAFNDSRASLVMLRIFNSWMDYITVGLRNNISSIRDLSFDDINVKVIEWHEELESSGGNINYTEEHPIILDFRDEDGFGYYWCDLQTNESNEECKRMGHCGRSNAADTLFSLRSYKGDKERNYTINQSHLTMAINFTNGLVYQLKGKKNSKPSPKYHKYIVPLFSLTKDDYHGGDLSFDDDYLLQGLGFEYQSEKDFKFYDLSDDLLQKLYQIRPDLFDNYFDLLTLIQRGIEVESDDRLKVEITLSLQEWGNVYFVDTVGNYDGKSINLFTAAFEYPQLVIDSELINSRSSIIFLVNYYMSNENKNKIVDLLVPDELMDNLDLLEFEDIFRMFDQDGRIMNKLVDITTMTIGRDFIDELKREILKTISKDFGRIIKFDGHSVTVDVDFTKLKLVEDDEEYLRKIVSLFKTDLNKLFRTLATEDLFDIDQFKVRNSYQTTDFSEFNELISDYLDNFHK